MNKRRIKTLAGICATIIIVTLWLFDPAAYRIKMRYPEAQIENFHECRWLIPAFLYSIYNPDDTNTGYLAITISDKKGNLDLSVFESPPVFSVELNRCTVTDISPLYSWPYYTGIVFNDCDLSQLPDSQLASIGSPLPGTTNRFSYGGP